MPQISQIFTDFKQPLVVLSKKIIATIFCKYLNVVDLCTNYKKSVLSIFFIVLCFSSFAENSDSCIVKLNKRYFKSYLKNTKDFFISPIKWNNNQWFTFIGFVGITEIIMSEDLNIQQYSQKIRSTRTDNIVKYGFEPFGSGIYSMPLMAAFISHGLISKNKRGLRVGLLGIEAYLLSGVFVNIPKYLFNRHRPYHDKPSDPYIFDGPFTGDYYRSFFSGHTTSVFAVATIVASEYDDKPLVPILCYSIATLSGYSRINDNKHWASDVFGGAVFGYVIGRLIYKNGCDKIKIIPSQTSKYSGVSIFYNLN
ncbi:MAG: hypothetical protein A2046_04580 [Bacteroidetes bacterium GWA2_30_7]|nr:MAG: hypothetical protein A2046_04580 [Bacteroidetes bacterium GWA2_30_7]